MENDLKIYNLIGQDSAELFLYGTIGQGEKIDTTLLIPQLDELRRQGVKNLRLNLNSDGGCVMQGQALFNYLNRNNFAVTWCVDGIAASMAAMIISNPAHRVEMARYSKLMYHRVSGGAGGTADDLRDYAEMLELFEKDLIDMLAARTGLPADEITTRYFDGRDHWISADEAIRLKLADEIITGIEDITAPEKLTDNREIVNYYTKQLLHIKNQAKNMNLKRITSVLNLADDTSEEVIYNTLKTMTENRATLENRVKEQNTEITNLKGRIKEFEGAKVKTLIDGAITAKKFGEDLRDVYTRFAESDYDGTAAAIAKMPGVPRVVDQLGTDAPNVPDSEKNWTWDDYFKANRLESLKAVNRARFEALYKSKFGKEYIS